MYPILIEWGHFVIPAWHAFFALGAVAAYFALIWLSRRHFPALSEPDLGWLFACSYIGGYFGARLLSVFIDEAYLSLSEKAAALFKLGPMTFYGGFIGAFAAGMAFAAIRKMPKRDLCDLALICGMIGLALGRVGCFLNGDDYGIPLQIESGRAVPWWGVIFPNHADPIPRAPVQLLEAGAASLISAFGILYFDKLRTVLFPGAVAIVVASAYAVSRFFLEFLRGDPRGSIIDGILSPSQLLSILVLVGSNIALIVALKRRPLKPQSN